MSYHIPFVEEYNATYFKMRDGGENIQSTFRNIKLMLIDFGGQRNDNPYQMWGICNNDKIYRQKL